MHDKIIDAVFERALAGVAVKAAGVGFVFAENSFPFFFAPQIVIAQRSMARLHRVRVVQVNFRARGCAAPGPRVAKPKRGHQHQGCIFHAAISYAQLNQNVVRCGFGILHVHIEVAVAVQYAGVREFIFAVGL